MYGDGHVREPFGVTKGVSVDNSDSCEPPSAVNLFVAGNGKGRDTGENLVGVLVTAVGVVGVSVWRGLLCATCELEGRWERSAYPTSRYGRCDSRSGMITGSVDLRSSVLDLLTLSCCWSDSCDCDKACQSGPDVAL
jgi:hypothetical protein